MRKALALGAVIAIALAAYLSQRGSSTSQPAAADAMPVTASQPAPTPARRSPLPPRPVVPSELPAGVPTRAEVNAVRTAPPSRPLPESTDVATPSVAEELDSTRVALEERARGCSAGTATEVEVDVKMVFRDGAAHVREAQVKGSTVAAAVRQCVAERLVGHTWIVASDDKVFGMTVALRP